MHPHHPHACVHFILVLQYYLSTNRGVFANAHTHTHTWIALFVTCPAFSCLLQNLIPRCARLVINASSCVRYGNYPQTYARTCTHTYKGMITMNTCIKYEMRQCVPGCVLFISSHRRVVWRRGVGKWWEGNSVSSFPYQGETVRARERERGGGRKIDG